MRKIISKIHLRTWIAMALIIIVLPVIAFVLFSPETTSAEWFNEQYSHRQRFSFTHNANITSPRAITFTLDTAELITAGVMQADCDDTRFTNIDGTLLPFELTGTCNNASTTYEVIFNEIENGTNVGYVYYGNTAAVNVEINSSAYTALTPSGGDPAAITDRTNEEDTPGPVVYWRFDEGVNNSCSGGTNDSCNSVGSQYDGAFTSSPIWTDPDQCVSGTCLYFDGSDDLVNYGDMPIHTRDFTITAWIKPISLTADQGTIVSKYGSDADAFLFRTQTDGSIEFITGFGANTYKRTPSDSVVLNEWQHVAVVYYEATDDADIFVNGELLPNSQRDNNLSTISDTTDPVTIGRRTTNFDEFHGFIDEVKIYFSTRTSDQIKDDYYSRGGVDAPITFGESANALLSDNLKGYWKADENSWNGTTDEIKDASGNDNHGTAGTGATTTAGKFDHGGEINASTEYFDFDLDQSVGQTKGTIAFWYKETTDASAYESFFNTTKGGNNFAFYRDNNDTVLDFKIENTEASWGSLPINVFDGEFHHLALVYDTDEDYADLYIDGQFQGRENVSFPAVDFGSNSYSWRWGNEADGNGQAVDGIIDEIRSYDRVMSEKEIIDIYNHAPGPVVYLPMDENTGTTTTYDRSGNGYNGTLNGTMTTDDWVPGRFGSALDFDGTDDRIQLGYTQSPEDESISLSAWIYIDGGTGEKIIFSQENGSFYDSIKFYVNLDWNFVGLFRDFSTSAGTWDTNDNSITTGSWHHVAVTYDGSSTSNDPVIYIDGVRQTFQTDTNGSGTSDNSTHNWYIGGFESGSEYFNGKIDDARIYNYIRTDAQIIEDMNGSHPLGGSPVGSQWAYWSFDHFYDQNIYDKKDVYNGTLGSSTAVSTDDPTPLDPGNCMVNVCLDFDGGDFVELNNNDQFDVLSGDLALTGWFYRDTFSNVNTIISNKDNNTSTTAGFGLFIDGTSDELVFQIGDGTNGYEMQSNRTFTSTGWHHFAIVWDEDSEANTKMYIDGIQESTDNTGTHSSVGSVNGATDLIIGCESDNGNCFEGRLDEIKIYATTLSTENVFVDMNFGAATSFGVGQEEDDVDGTWGYPFLEWKLDENTGTQVYDTGYNDEDAEGTSLTQAMWIPCISGSCVDFSQGDVGVVSKSSVDPPAQGSVSFWMYYVDADVNVDRPFGRGDAFEARIDSDILYFDLGITGAQTTCASSSTIPANEWHHYLLTYDSASNTCEIYIDSVFDNSSTSETIDDPASGLLYIGRSTTADYFEGRIDEFRIYDYVMSQEQVAYEYNRGKPIAHWKLDECQGNTIHNSISSSYHGTLTIGGTGANTSTGTCSGSSGEAWNAGTSGKYNSAIDLDGTDDYIEATQQLTAQYPFSVSMWAKTDDCSDFYTLFQLSDVSESNVYYRVGILNSGSGCVARIAASNTTLFTNSGSTTFGDSEWHHIVGIFNSETDRQLWIDGKLEATGTNSVGYNTNVDTWSIGRAGDSTPSNYTDGQIDDVRFYNYALTSEQIKKIMLGGESGSAVRFGN